MIKPLISSNDLDWLFIKGKVGFVLWPVLREFFKVNMVICHFLYKYNKRKRINE
jgi:hypothetical protein